MSLAIDAGRGSLPGPDTSVFAPRLIAEGYTGPVVRYGDRVWPMAPMNGNPSADVGAIYWDAFPAGLREEFRLVAWVLINGELTTSFLRERPASWRTRTSAPIVYQTAWNWRRLAIWMHAQGLGSLRSCDSKTLDRYGSFLLENGTARNTVHKALIALTRLWVFDGLGPNPWASADHPGTSTASMTTCRPRQAPRAGRTSPRNLPPRRWGRCWSGRSGWSMTTPRTS